VPNPKSRMERHWKLKIDRKEACDPIYRVTCDPIYRSKGETLAGGGKVWSRTACVFDRDVNVQ